MEIDVAQILRLAELTGLHLAGFDDAAKAGVREICSLGLGIDDADLVADHLLRALAIFDSRDEIHHRLVVQGILADRHAHWSFLSATVGVIEYPASFSPRLISWTTTSSGSSSRSPGIHSVMLSTTAITSSAVRVGAADGWRIMQVRRSITR